MAYKFEEGKDSIIAAVVNKLKQTMGEKQGRLCAEFIWQFYETVALDDLEEWSLEDLYGAAMNFWSLIRQRAPDETKIRIYNPDFEKYGWQTTHTIIEIITEDMPFLVDSLRMLMNRLGLISHLIIHMGGLRIKRNQQGEATAVLPRNLDNSQEGELNEAVIFIEVDRQTDAKALEKLHQHLEQVLADNQATVKDWPLMRQKVCEAITELDEVATVLDADEVAETKAFLNWVEDHHFTFLGVRDYKLVRKKGEMLLEPIPQTGLGLLRPEMSKSSVLSLSTMPPEAQELMLSTHSIMVMSKTNTESTVHRRAYTDYIGIKRFNKKREVIGERRIIGLYTSAAYNTSPKYIPFLRHKVARVMEDSNLNPKGHAGKVLLNILETLPRDDLIQASEDELLEIAMGIYYTQERRRIRLFARVDVYRRFISCFVYVPRDLINAALREAMQKILSESFHSDDISASTWFSESILARVHYIIRIDPTAEVHWDFKAVEKKLIEASRTWTDELQHYLFEIFGEEVANQLYLRYKSAFPIAYTANFSPRVAVYDIKHMETLSKENPLVMNFYNPMDEEAENFHLKIYQHDNTLPLSDVLPIMEQLGMRAISERPYVLKFDDGKVTWINDFTLQQVDGRKFELDEIRERFQNAFINVWFGCAENDGFNQLVLAAGLNWWQVAIIRTYAKYFKQIRFIFSQEYIETALKNNPLIAKKCVELFEIRFNPEENTRRDEAFNEKAKEIFTALESVANLDEDRIIRQYVHAISATLRTNYYQQAANGKQKSYISIKLNCKEVPGVPKPYPMFEIFVYSPRFEGVHLRGGKVARGGLRWSDRREDFRTEVLGLMKAQQVKNAIIVPSGAKGGFVPKQLPAKGTREEILAEGIACYQLFIRGLLDITDNYRGFYDHQTD